MEKLKIIGSFLGVEFKEEKKNKGFVPFQSPDSYKHLSPEERERLTREQMSSHKEFIEGRNIRSTLLGKSTGGLL